jgi:hypothetical protein
MDAISRWPAFHIAGEIAEKLKTISPATIDGYLKKDRDALRLKGKSLAKPLYSLKSRIPIRTFYSGEERKTPGFWQIDTVHHCGQTTHGQYVHTLTATDAASGWMRTFVRELRSLLNNAHSWTFKALSDIKTTVPLPVLEFHSDNGSEFINNATEIRCKKEHLPFTRSRDHKKNDNCFIEQKNGAAVREYAGYDRLEGYQEQALLAAIYTPWFLCSTSSCPPKSSKAKRGQAPKRSRFMTNPEARSKGSLKTPDCRKGTRTPSMPSVPFTTRSFFSKMSTRLSCVCVNGSHSQTAFKRGYRNSFGNIF